MYRLVFILILMLVPAVSAAPAPEPTKWIISSGATAQLPAGSLAGLALSIERGAEAVKLDLVSSADDQVVVLADPRLNESTDAATLYPDRVRSDDALYALDLMLDELDRISRVFPEPGAEQPATIPPLVHRGVLTLAQALGYLARIEPELEDDLSVIFEIRKGWLHQREGKDLSGAIIDTMNRFGGSFTKIKLFIASYDPAELQYLYETMLPPSLKDAGLIQLIDDNNGSEVMSLQFGQYKPYNFDWLLTRFGLKAASGYARVIGITPAVLFDSRGDLKNPDYLADAHSLGLKIFAYPSASGDVALALSYTGEEEDVYFEQLLFSTGLDGLLTSRDRRLRTWLEERSIKNNSSPQQQTIERLIEQFRESGITPKSPLQSDITR